MSMKSPISNKLKNPIRNKRKSPMTNKAKNIISIILPLTTLFIIAIALKNQPTGLAVYEDENKPLYKLNGSINITLQEELPADSYIQIEIDNYLIKLNLIEFLEKSKKPYQIKGQNIIADNTYTVDFTSLGIIQRFEEGNHKIRVEIINKGSILYTNEKMIGT